MEKKKFYITTPIYYPSDKLHIGHTYCTVATDAMARYKRLTGCDVMFLTGTDEHGQKIEDKAKAAGKTPKEFLDEIVEGPRGILDLWKLMNISNDRFIRTTDDYHVASIQKIFRKMYDKGDIYKGTYRGKYCKPCESFWTESQLVDGKCPDCGREVTDAEEEAYFFRLSKYADRVRHLLEDTDFLEPRSRVNEMVNNFIKPGLEDLCVSRTSFSWGIPVDFDPGHVVYVWGDLAPEGAEVFCEVQPMLDAAGEDAFVIGGAQVYRLLLPACRRLYVTQIDADGGADVFFPEPAPELWRITEQSPWQEEQGLRYRYLTYERKDGTDGI